LDGFGQEKTLLPLSGFEPTNRPAGNLVIILTELTQLASNTFVTKITNYAPTYKVICLNKYSVVAMSRPNENKFVPDYTVSHTIRLQYSY
jgi:hypothetical protein